MKVAVISDTHGLLRPEVLDILSTCDVILHGGDINRQDIVDRLRQIAPLYVVRGNNDKEWAEEIPCSLVVRLEKISIFMTHKKKDLPEDISEYDLIINGHTHRFEHKYVGDKEFLNPGCCGPRKETQPITMAVLHVKEKYFEIEKIEIPHN